jgi:hypothetical protein
MNVWEPTCSEKRAHREHTVTEKKVFVADVL